MKPVTTWTVFRCAFADKDAYMSDSPMACGFNGALLDHSRAECHHPMSLDETKEIAQAMNAHDLMVSVLRDCDLLLSSPRRLDQVAVDTMRRRIFHTLSLAEMEPHVINETNERFGGVE